MKYVTKDEFDAHRTAMQQVVEEKKRLKEASDVMKKRAIKAAQKALNRAIESAQDAFNESVKESVKKADLEHAAIERVSNCQLAAMQREFEHLPLLRQVYHEAPYDVFELIVAYCNKVEEGWGRGGLNAFRLASKRCKEVVESCTTKLSHLQHTEPYSLPASIMKRCGRIEEISCPDGNLVSLEGCPSGLKVLQIFNSFHFSDLSPLATCTMMERLVFIESCITDISVVSSMPLLEEFRCQQDDFRGPCIKDISPLSSCSKLRAVNLIGNDEVQDLSPLSACTALEVLDIQSCPRITSLESLSTMRNLKDLYCHGIHPATSLLPLVSCSALKVLGCDDDAVDLWELRKRRPDIQINIDELE